MASLVGGLKLNFFFFLLNLIYPVLCFPFPWLSPPINLFSGDGLNITSTILNDHILGYFYQEKLLPHVLYNSINLDIYCTWVSLGALKLPHMMVAETLIPVCTANGSSFFKDDLD